MQSLYIIIFKLLGLLPLWLLRQIGKLIAGLICRLKTQAYRVARKNIKVTFPEMSQAQQVLLTKQTLRDNIRVFAETPYVWTRSESSIRALYNEVDDQALVSLRDNHQPFIVLAPHIGNWELLGYYLGEHYDNASMYLPSRQGEKVDAFIKSARSRFGNLLLPANPDGVKAFYRHAKAGKPVSILPDQSPSSESGMVYATFFDQTAATIVLPAKVARKNQLPTYLGYAVYNSLSRRYQLGFRAVEGFGQQADLAADVQLMNDAIEKLVRDFPTQYLWTYKRFKRQPKDSSLHDQFYR